MLTSDKQNVGKCINLQWIFVSYKIDINAIHIETACIQLNKILDIM